MERFIRHGSIEDCADLLYGIKHLNDSLNKKGEVATPKVWKMSYAVQEKKIVLIFYLDIQHHSDSQNKRGEVSAR